MVLPLYKFHMKGKCMLVYVRFLNSHHYLCYNRWAGSWLSMLFREQKTLDVIHIFIILQEYLKIFSYTVLIVHFMESCESWMLSFTDKEYCLHYINDRGGENKILESAQTGLESRLCLLRAIPCNLSLYLLICKLQIIIPTS